jgi:NADH-quinone oxidoreductase subunit C
LSSVDEATEAPAPEVDEARQALLDALTAELGAAVLASEIAGGDICVRVDRASWRAAVEACRDKLGMDYFCFLSGIDWMDAPDLSGEKAWDPDAASPSNGGEDASTAPETKKVAGGESRFQVFARLYSTTKKLGVTLKADLDDAAPSVETITTVYRGADWHERETWEMYGFDFVGHPGLRHLYLPSEFEGFPLRKDFPLLAREVKPWPGLVDVEPIPGGGDDAEADADAEAAE